MPFQQTIELFISILSNCECQANANEIASEEMEVKSWKAKRGKNDRKKMVQILVYLDSIEIAWWLPVNHNHSITVSWSIENDNQVEQSGSWANKLSAINQKYLAVTKWIMRGAHNGAKKNFDGIGGGEEAKGSPANGGNEFSSWLNMT